MASELEGIKEITEALLGIGDVAIDNFTFKLFYKWSVSFYITSSVLVQASQFFGDPMACETVSTTFNVCGFERHSKIIMQLGIRGATGAPLSRLRFTQLSFVLCIKSCSEKDYVTDTHMDTQTPTII